MTDPRSYDLLCAPWIPVVWREESNEPKKPKIGIRKALERAHEIRAISHTSPFIEFGLYRLLITIVLDAYIDARKRPTIGKMKDMLAATQFDSCVIKCYLEKYKASFELWGAGPRFLQRQPAEGTKTPESKAIVSMYAAIPSGTNVSHWHHVPEDDIAVTEDVAAQFLATVSPWNFKTKPGEVRTLAGDPPMYALVLGETLFETILLNLPRPSGRTSSRIERDNGPVWRTPLKDFSKLPKSPAITQGFTWPVRVIQLGDEMQDVVNKAVNQAAYKDRTKEERAKKGNLFVWRDPNAGTETGPVAVDHIKVRPSVPVWRDAVPLFLVASQGEALRGEKRRSRPEVVNNALRILEGTSLRVAVYGMRKKSGGGGDVKVEEWFRSALTLPAEVARDERLSFQALDGFKTAQKVADALQVALRMLRPKMAALPRAKKDLRNAQRTEGDVLAGFWQGLEPVLAHNYLNELVIDSQTASNTLKESLRKESRDAFARASAPLRRSADGLFRIANAGNYLERRLAQLLPKEKKT
ncbi:MAG TPA: type I-E CRISPR-associated protein Cse1/CasA [Fimbriimonadaceae bacterium]|nr:type I-E CRISPR-associated protein Cse1/CasA [Fimbriimonadaceae bacterium]